MTICPDINGFQIPVKTSCTGHRWCKTKDFFVFCSGKTCLVCFHGFWFFCSICHLCLVHKINAQTPITAILSTYLIHEFIVNVKCRMDGSQTLYLLLVWFLDTIFCQWNMFNFGEYAWICHLPLASLKELHFPWLILKFPDLTYGERLIFLARWHMSHTNIVRRSKIQMFFSNIK